MTDDADAPAPKAGRIRITHLSGSMAGQVKELDPGETKFGRHPESAIRYDHMTDFLVSTRHGYLTYAEGKWWFVDANSTNGTYIGSTRVNGKAPIQNGQIIVLGTPGAAGSASFRAETSSSPMAETIAMDAPEGKMAQEPSEELAKLECANCKHVNVVASEDFGHAVCERCGKMLEQTPVRPAAVKPPPPQTPVQPSVDPFLGVGDSFDGTLPPDPKPLPPSPPARNPGPVSTPKPSPAQAKPTANDWITPEDERPELATFKDFPKSPPRPKLAPPPAVNQAPSPVSKPSMPGPSLVAPGLTPRAPEPVAAKPATPESAAMSADAPRIQPPIEPTGDRKPPAPKPPTRSVPDIAAEDNSRWLSDIEVEPFVPPVPTAKAPTEWPSFPERSTPPVTIQERPAMASMASPSIDPPARSNPPETIEERIPARGEFAVSQGKAPPAIPPFSTDRPLSQADLDYGLQVEPAKSEKPAEGGEGFFGSILGAINRRRERKEILRDLGKLEQQAVSLESDLTQACVTLGGELWRASKEKLGTFRAARQLIDADSAITKADERQLAIDREFGERTVEFQSWLAEWQEQSSTLDVDLSAADKALTETASELSRVREAIAAGYSAKAAALASQGKQFQELAEEARQDPPDDLWPRLVSAVEATVAGAESLKTPIADLESLLSARQAAKEAVSKATARRDEVVAQVADHRKEREEMDAAQSAITKANDEHRASHRKEVERIRASLTAAHGDLGRQFVESPQALAEVNPPALSFSNAKAAADRLTQARQSIDQKKRRLAELDAV